MAQSSLADVLPGLWGSEARPVTAMTAAVTCDPRPAKLGAIDDHIDLACAMHVHSRHSDGSGSIEEIAGAAAEVGVDVVLVTDHDTLAAKRRGEEGWYGRVLVLAGIELSPKRRDHYLAFGLDEEIEHEGLDAAAMCAAVQRSGGFGFAAHPFSTGSHMALVRGVARPQRWRDLERPCLSGIEVWNLETEGAERLRTPGEALRFLHSPETALREPSAEALAAWDRLGRRRRVVGVAGLDAHQKGLRLGHRVLSPLRYSRLMRHVRMRLIVGSALSGELERDRGLVYRALRGGRCYIAVESLARARGFRLWAERDGGRLAMGEEAALGPWTLRVRSPLRARLRLLRDGQPVAEERGHVLDAPADAPGVWRAEACLDARDGERLWVLTNPVYLRAPP